jgi:hypothetical protein
VRSVLPHPLTTACGLTASTDGPERPRTISECQSVSALVAGALEALDRDDAAAARALLRAIAARLALPGG